MFVDPQAIFERSLEENKKAWDAFVKLDTFEECWRYVLHRPFPKPPPTIGIHQRAVLEVQAHEDAKVFEILDAIASEADPVNTPPEPPSRFDRI